MSGRGYQPPTVGVSKVEQVQNEIKDTQKLLLENSCVKRGVVHSFACAFLLCMCMCACVCVCVCMRVCV
jgi:hypothetical protein